MTASGLCGRGLITGLIFGGFSFHHPIPTDSGVYSFNIGTSTQAGKGS